MIRVAPVGVGGGGNVNVPSMVGDPILAQVLKNLVQPHFGGSCEEWPEFVLQWENYFLKLSSGREVKDEIKLQLLEPCLNMTDRKELQLLAKISDGGVTFNQFWAKLAARYGEELNACARRRWRELVLVNTGKINLIDWRNFKIKFCDI